MRINKGPQTRRKSNLDNIITGVCLENLIIPSFCFNVAGLFMFQKKILIEALDSKFKHAFQPSHNLVLFFVKIGNANAI